MPKKANSKDSPRHTVPQLRGTTQLQLVLDDSRHYTMKVTNATDCSQASTVVDVDQVCAKSAKRKLTSKSVGPFKVLVEFAGHTAHARLAA